MTSAVAVFLWGAGALAQPAPATAPAPPVAPAPAVVAPAAPPPAPPVVEAPLPVPAAPGAEVAAPAEPARVAPGPVPTADETPAASDHDAVVRHVGLEVRRLDVGPFGFDLRPGTGCPAVQTTTPCRVDMGALAIRYWQSRSFGVTGGLALAFGGGRDMDRTLDSYVGVGPVVGVSLLLGNWRHLAVAASPEATFVYFKPGGDSTSSTKLVTVRAALEGELHFGFVGVPALSVGLVTGLGFRYASTPDSRVWSIGVVGPGSVWGVLTDLFVRYYL